MDWDAPAIVLDTRPYGEGDAVATVMTEQHGVHRGLARGGASRGKAAIWQAGNMVQVQWIARLSDQLGSFTGELIHAGAAHAMQEALPLSMLTAICAIAEGALPEREPLPRVFDGLLRLIPRVPLGESVLTDLIVWEMTVLSDLGYGLDLSVCTVTGRTDGLAYVSPKTGRAVTREGAGEWATKLLPLPPFLVSSTRQSGERDELADASTATTAPTFTPTSWPGLARPPTTLVVAAPQVVGGRAKPGHDVGGRGHDVGGRGHDAGGRGHDVGGLGHDERANPTAPLTPTPPNWAAWRDGLRLTGYFLARDAFGHHHRPLPLARAMLYDRVAAEAAKDDVTNDAG